MLTGTMESGVLGLRHGTAEVGEITSFHEVPLAKGGDMNSFFHRVEHMNIRST